MDSLQPLGSLLDRELDLLILTQGAESIALDGRVMDKYVLCALTGDESISFGIIEPFDGSSLFFSHFYYSLILARCEFGEAVGAEQKKTTQFPQAWTVFDSTAKTYFILTRVFYHTCAE